jgi:hypothetical protein
LPPWEIESSPPKNTYNQKEEKNMKEILKTESGKVIEKKKTPPNYLVPHPQRSCDP